MMLTVKDASKKIQERFGGDPVPEHIMRRAFDDLELMGKLDVERVANGTRLVKESDKNLITIANRLREKEALDPELAAVS